MTLMTTLGNYNTDVSDMYAVHKALTGALEAAPAYVAKAGVDSERVEVIGSFCENVIEFLHVHHTGEDELIYPVLEQRCAESRSELERINDQHKLLDAPMDAGRSAIATWRAAPSTDNAQAVIDALASIVEPLRPHLAEEETVLLADRLEVDQSRRIWETARSPHDELSRRQAVAHDGARARATRPGAS